MVIPEKFLQSRNWILKLDFLITLMIKNTTEVFELIFCFEFNLYPKTSIVEPI